MESTYMKISIITINKNNSTGLEKTIQSVTIQTYKELEYIVIDGASTDRSLDIIKAFGSKITYWESNVDGGVYQAMNKGVLKASGDYCLFLNSGDVFCNSNSLNDLLGTLSKEDIIFGDITFDENTIHFPDKITFYNLRWGYIPHPASAIKRSLFKTFGLYNENNKCVSDWEFWILALILNNSSYRHITKNIVQIETPGLSSLDNENETNMVLHRLIPDRILEDYDYFKELETKFDNPLMHWIINNKKILKINKALYTIRNSIKKKNIKV